MPNCRKADDFLPNPACGSGYLRHTPALHEANNLKTEGAYLGQDIPVELQRSRHMSFA